MKKNYVITIIADNGERPGYCSKGLGEKRFKVTYKNATRTEALSKAEDEAMGLELTYKSAYIAGIGGLK